MKFPLYVKQPSGQVWYRIDSSKAFCELRRMGSKVIKSEVVSEDYSTSMYIQDLIESVQTDLLETISEADFQKIEELAH